jgi:hypothetical protein
MASQVRQISRQRDEAPRCFERPARKKLVMSTSLSDANATLQLESASDFQLDDPWPMPRPTAIHPQRRGRPKLRRDEPPGFWGPVNLLQTTHLVERFNHSGFFSHGILATRDEPLTPKATARVGKAPHTTTSGQPKDGPTLFPEKGETDSE